VVIIWIWNCAIIEYLDPRVPTSAIAFDSARRSANGPATARRRPRAIPACFDVSCSIIIAYVRHGNHRQSA